MDSRLLQGTGTLVVKIGSSTLIDEQGEARAAWIASLAERLATRPGPVVIVSSGAIGLGRGALGLDRRPATLAEAQAAAAIGQIELARTWREVWARQGRTVAQVLLTLGDLEDRARYLNARDTIETLLARGVVPIVNENDTVATSEIRFGDNDRLAARTAQLVGADLLVLLSDVAGLFDADPRSTPDALRIAEVDRIDARIEALAGPAGSTGFGTGGMVTKLAAARIATEAGCPVLLTLGRTEDPFGDVEAGCAGTWFHPVDRPLNRRKQWLRGLQNHSGSVAIDAGAAEALQRGASLLATGVLSIDGRFDRGALVRIETAEKVLGQGLTAYASADLERIRGRQSTAFAQRLGHAGRGPVVHRDDLVLFAGA